MQLLPRCSASSALHCRSTDARARTDSGPTPFPSKSRRVSEEEEGRAAASNLSPSFPTSLRPRSRRASAWHSPTASATKPAPWAPTWFLLRSRWVREENWYSTHETSPTPSSLNLLSDMPMNCSAEHSPSAPARCAAPSVWIALPVRSIRFSCPSSLTADASSSAPPGPIWFQLRLSDSSASKRGSTCATCLLPSHSISFPDRSKCRSFVNSPRPAVRARKPTSPILFHAKSKTSTVVQCCSSVARSPAPSAARSLEWRLRERRREQCAMERASCVAPPGPILLFLRFSSTMPLQNPSMLASRPSCTNARCSILLSDRSKYTTLPWSLRPAV
mmetsp:Transcript_27072/g.63893  ORF Transcript_27072/g.63893 Transcript_27072/m.63893 type:complete len:332 (-) Transcript_27072:553-1548(-)